MDIDLELAKILDMEAYYYEGKPYKFHRKGERELAYDPFTESMDSCMLLVPLLRERRLEECTFYFIDDYTACLLAFDLPDVNYAKTVNGKGKTEPEAFAQAAWKALKGE